MRLVSKWNALFPTEIPNGNFPKFLVNGKQPKRLEVVARSEIPDLKSYIEILVYKLKMHHENAGNLKCATIVEERRKACIEWGLIEQKHAYLVTSAFEPLPLCETEDEEDPEKDDELGKPPGICCVSQTIFFQPVLCY